MKINVKKIIKIGATAYTLYKANQTEVDAAYRWAKKQVKKKKSRDPATLHRF